MGAIDNIRRFLTPGDYQEAAALSAESGDKFSPGVPIRPADGFSRTPRAHDFLTGYNIAARPRRNERVSFQTLQGLVEAYDIAQMAITHRIDSIRSLEWYLEPIDGYDGDTDAIIAYAKKILASPDRELPFRAWLSKFLWDTLAYDAGTLYRMRNNAGQVIGLKVVDGTTIAPLLDYHGGRPMGDAPAYVQYAQGVPWNWLTQSDIIYVPFRPMPNSPYGKSPLESILLNANTDLRFQNYFLSRFTEGTVPEGFATAPESWGPDQIADFQDAWEAMMYGDDSKKHQIRWVPGGTNFTWSQENPFQAEFSLFLMRKTAAAFHVTPNDLGFTDTVNLANGETQTDVQFRIGDLPMVQHVEDILTSFLVNDLGLPLQFQFNTGQEKEDRLMAAQVAQIMINSGVLSPSEVREEMYGLSEPDGVVIPRFFNSGSGLIPVANLLGIAGTVDIETAIPEENTELPTSFSPAEGVIAKPEAPVLKEGETVGITSETGTVGNPMLSDDDEDEEDAEVAKSEERAAFKRFVKARKRDGKWRDFQFNHITKVEADILNTEGKMASAPVEPLGWIAVVANDTGRVLMEQRLYDPKDPNAGMFDFPGGHVEGNESFRDAALREFSEEIGLPLPAGEWGGTWTTKNGLRHGFVYRIPAETDIDLRAARTGTDPDMAGGGEADSVLWLPIDALKDNPLVRRDIRENADKVVEAVDAVPLVKGWRDQPDTVPQHKYDRLIVDEYAPQIADALNRVLEKMPVVEAIKDTRNSFQKANADFEEDLDEFGEEYPYDGAKPSTGAGRIERKSMAAQIATTLAVAAGTAILAEVLKSLYVDAITSSAYAASVQTGLPLSDELEFSRYTATLDMREWTPGDERTADLVRGDGLANLLDSAGITITSIDQRSGEIYRTTVDQLANKIANGIQQGWSVHQIGRELREYVSDPRRADMIAHTETARAMFASTVAVYRANGIEMLDYIAEADACDDCALLEADAPYPVDSFDESMLPVHPSCRCAVSPVVDLGVVEPEPVMDMGEQPEEIPAE